MCYCSSWSKYLVSLVFLNLGILIPMGSMNIFSCAYVLFINLLWLNVCLYTMSIILKLVCLIIDLQAHTHILNTNLLSDMFSESLALYVFNF